MEDAVAGPASNHSPHPGDSSRVSKRLRKREQDRLAQRAARQRNKQRIAELEATVARLSSQSGSGEVIASLESKLAAVTRERDHLAKSLSSIRDIVSSHHPTGLFTITTSPPGDALIEEDNAPQCSPLIVASETSPNVLDDAGAFEGLALPNFTEPMPCQDHIQPPPQIPCDCVSPLEENGREAAGPSIWRTANATLGSSHTMSNECLLFEERTSEDFAVRAVLEGWDSLAPPGSLSPMWTKLRRIDDLQFSSCRNVERLAIMFLMHSLLMFHARPTEDQRGKLPPWYIQRPSQELSYSYAIDFFVWPGIRDRFVFSQHKYCSNHFWRVFASSFRLLWPHDFRDCYKLNIETGRYTLSADFTSHIRDLRLWTMQNDFFHFFPDLQSDIPVSETVARSPSTRGPGRLIPRRRRPLHSRRGKSASEYESQSDEQTVPDYWDNIAFGQTATSLPFSLWAQTAANLDCDFVAGREGTSCDILPPFYEH